MIEIQKQGSFISGALLNSAWCITQKARQRSYSSNNFTNAVTRERCLNFSIQQTK
jgi:hypothetical protein